MSPGQYELIPRKGGAGKRPITPANTPICSINQGIFKTIGVSLTPAQSSRLAGQAEAMPFIFETMGLIRALLSIPKLMSYFLSFSFLSFSKEARLEKGL